MNRGSTTSRPKRLHLWSGNIRHHLSERSSKQFPLQVKCSLYTIFWDTQGVLLLNFLKVGTINANRYCDFLSKLKEVIRKKRHGLLGSGVLLLDDNARPHSGTATENHIATLDWERLHHPPYSSDLATSDFHLFPALKKNLVGRRFGSNAEVKQGVKHLFRMQSPQFFL
ncbi:histone-lysine N-methyltransferase SETMAR [Trichonephila clavipes]|nr:histone-lysine N-methyltransferase SETMAR [Trichonephila clavipes]